MNLTRLGKLNTLIPELKRNPNVLNATSSSSVPGQDTHEWGVSVPSLPEDERNMTLSVLAIDFDYLDTFEIEIAQGRGFQKDIASDTFESVLVNEKLVQLFNWEDPIGMKMVLGSDDDMIVIGVIKDYHYESLHNNIEPLVITHEGDYRSYRSVKVRSENIAETIAYIGEQFKIVDPDHPHEYFFLDESFDGLYRSEQQMGTVFRYFSLLAILIACLGLLGLASFAAEQRTKEIGIRKVLGASTSTILRMMSREFVILIFLSNLISWPLAYLTMDKWLQNFAFRIVVPWEYFLFSGMAALVIALAIVVIQSLKTSLANPVDTIRYE